jgi:conjugal transfer pilus assembly protein TrbC
MESAVSPSAELPCSGEQEKNIPYRAKISPTCSFAKGIAVSATNANRLCHLFRSTIISCVCLTAHLVALAQSAPIITDADIEQAKTLQPNITDEDIERAQKRYRMPTESELNRVPINSTPNIEALPVPKTSRNIGLEAIAKGYEINSDRMASAQGLASEPRLLIFVSFTMPELALVRLIDQAARSGATIVIRGLIEGSLTKTVSIVHKLIGKRRVAVQIDPQAFDRFSVMKAPAFVLVKDGAQTQPCAAGMCFSMDSFALTTGDVSLDYALEHIINLSPNFAKNARAYLLKLRGQ